MCMYRMYIVCRDFSWPFPDQSPVQVLDGVKVGPDVTLYRPKCLLLTGPVLFSGWARPHSDECAQNIQNNFNIEDD